MKIKILFVIAISTLSLKGTYAQYTNWIHTWGGKQEDAATSVAVDRDGNYVIAGNTGSFGKDTSNILLQKYDNYGNLIWSVTWGGNASDAASDAAVDDSNNIYVTGYSSSFGSGWYDALLLKFNQNGSLMWSKVWGGNSYDAGYGIYIDNDGNLLVSGESFSFGNAAVLLKFDTDGNFIWGKSWKSSATYDAAFSITADITGDIILTGISWNYFQSAYINKILIIKYDKSGNVLWSRNWGGSGLDETWGPNTVKADNSNNIYIAGRTQFGNGSIDALLLKIDAGGNLVWSKNWGGSNYDANSGIDMDSEGNIYTVGTTQSFSDNHGNLFLLRYDVFGNLSTRRIWNNAFDSKGNDILVNKNSLIIAGEAFNAYGTWETATGITGNPPGVFSAPSIEVSNLDDASMNIAGLIASPSGTGDAGSGSGDFLITNLSTLSNSSFLEFPLTNFTPYNVPIVSAFDHSGHRSCPNDTVENFIGEIALKKDLYEPPRRSDCGYLYSFKKNNGAKFLIGEANYVGTRGTGQATLNYDGNPGYDFEVDTGKAVCATANGKVIIAHNSDDSGLGMYIKILHENGYITSYMHLNKIAVNSGQPVNKGDLIGYTGITGGVTPSLYFEVEKIMGLDTVSIDPYGWQGTGADPYSRVYKVVNYNLWSAGGSNNSTVIMDELNDSTKGIATGINYIPSPSGKGALFSRQNESRISYPFSYGIPKEGTLEWWVNINSGYWYQNFNLFDDQTSAQLFGSDSYGGDVNWPGAMRLIVTNNGQIQLTTGNTYNAANYHKLIASSSHFNFNSWHSIGISYGSKGQYIMVDGIIAASDTTYRQPLGSAGNLSASADTPTIGQCISATWAHNQYDGGFNGTVDRFRASGRQLDWVLSDSVLTGIYNKAPGIPSSYSLSQNYPNPFNPVTTINFSVYKTSFVIIKVFDILGNEVAALVNEIKHAGNYSKEFNAANLSSGVYFYRMYAVPSSGSGKAFIETRKLILVK